MKRIDQPSYQGEDRRRPRKLLERFSREPIASTTLFVVLGVLAWGIVTTNTRSANEAKGARTNAEAANVNAKAARDLAKSIDNGITFIKTIGNQRADTNYQVHKGIQDTMICGFRILFTLPQDRSPTQLDTCVVPLARPPVPDPQDPGNQGPSDVEGSKGAHK